MKAKDVMTPAVVSVNPEASVRKIARLLLERRISAVPVVDDHDRVIGMVSEGDLMRRPESQTERHASWWLALLEGPDERAREYLKSHGLTARDVMTREPVTVTEDASLEEIATLLERKRIKRVPVLRAGKLVGIVSRANLLHGLVARGVQAPKSTASDTGPVREAVIAELRKIGLGLYYVNVVVEDGAAYLWGGVESAAERDAAALAAKRTPGVRRVENHLFVMPSWLVESLGTQ
jgi:CBS domain-containing protein